MFHPQLGWRSPCQAVLALGQLAEWAGFQVRGEPPVMNMKLPTLRFDYYHKDPPRQDHPWHTQAITLYAHVLAADARVVYVFTVAVAVLVG